MRPFKVFRANETDGNKIVVRIWVACREGLVLFAAKRSGQSIPRSLITALEAS
jgi:hypothetical protein